MYFIYIQMEEILDKIRLYNSQDYNVQKAVEELNELGAELMKWLNKPAHREERIPDIVGELADVSIRVNILIDMFGNDSVEDRVEKKLKKLNNYIKENRYTNV